MQTIPEKLIDADEAAPSWRITAASALILLISLFATAITSYFVWQTAAQRDATRFENLLQRSTAQIDQRIDTYIAMLYAGRGFFAANENVDRRQFHDFIDQLELKENYPGIQGIGFSRRVPADQVQEYISTIRKTQAEGGQGMAEFDIWPQHARPEYHAITYLEPLDRRNLQAIGYDMFTEATRREAMERARDTGHAAASGKVTLVQEIDEAKQAGFLIYVPVYRGGSVPETLEQRREDLIGFVYSPFRAGDLFDGIFGGESLPPIDFAAYDGASVSEDRLLRPGGPEFSPSTASHTSTTTLEIAGRPWTLVHATVQAFDESSSHRFGYIAPAVGLIMSLLLFTIALSESRALAQRKEAQKALARSQRDLADFFDNAAVGLHSVGQDGTILRANQAELDLMGYERDEYVGRKISDFHADKAAINEILARLASGEKIRDYPARVVRKDGVIRDVSITSSVHFENGTFRHTRCFTQDVTERLRDERRLLTQDKVTRTLARSETLKGAAPGILEAVCGHLDWQVGALWAVDKNDGFLRCVDVYQRPGYAAPKFEEVTREQMFERGSGLPGRVWSDEAPVWIGDVLKDKNFARASVARLEGFHAGFGFPIELHDEVLGVIEFYTSEIRDPDPGLLDMMTGIGSQIGQFIERRTAETEKSKALELEHKARSEAETLNELARKLAGELDIEALVQAVTDAATSLTGAEFGAFFYNAPDGSGVSYTLGTLSDASVSVLKKFPLPRNSPFFEPTFERQEVVRVDDIPSDPRWVKMTDDGGADDLAIRSFLAVPVVSRAAEVLGALSFGHPEPAVFTESEERMVVGIAAHAAVAMDNARLYADAQREIRHRKAAEAALRDAHDMLEMKVVERTVQLQRLTDELRQEVSERSAAEAQIRRVLARLVDIQEEERHRISRNIHDVLGQHLTAFRINLRSLVSSCERYDGLGEKALFVERLAQEIDASIDAVTWELRPADLDELGLNKALANLTASWSRRFDLPAEFSVVGESEAKVHPDIAVHLYRITQEALHNIYKHAGATHADVIVKATKDSLTLIIEDDGVGFDPEKNGGHGSLGLTSMRERATLINADLEIESAPDQGTAVFVRVPLSQRQSVETRMKTHP